MASSRNFFGVLKIFVSACHEVKSAFKSVNENSVYRTSEVRNDDDDYDDVDDDDDVQIFNVR